MSNRKLYGDLVPLHQLLDHLHEREQHFHDEIVPADRIEMVPTTGELLIQNGAYQEHQLQDQALGLLGSRLRIPGEYLKRCPSELRAENINTWLGRLGSKPLLVRYDGDPLEPLHTHRQRGCHPPGGGIRSRWEPRVPGAVRAHRHALRCPAGRRQYAAGSGR